MVRQRFYPIFDSLSMQFLLKYIFGPSLFSYYIIYPFLALPKKVDFYEALLSGSSIIFKLYPSIQN